MILDFDRSYFNHERLSFNCKQYRYNKCKYMFPNFYINTMRLCHYLQYDLTHNLYYNSIFYQDWFNNTKAYTPQISCDFLLSKMKKGILI